ncbi:hypothetical protein [Vibrio minamisatsumaniensis]|uniref:hypothetical protein n=1 Tax=Vibrio minamisatsumaniensis TaxID=2910243 RepID=UPI003D226464
MKEYCVELDSRTTHKGHSKLNRFYPLTRHVTVNNGSAALLYLTEPKSEPYLTLPPSNDTK